MPTLNSYYKKDDNKRAIFVQSKKTEIRIKEILKKESTNTAIICNATLLNGRFSCFLNCANSTKSRRAFHVYMLLATNTLISLQQNNGFVTFEINI